MHLHVVTPATSPELGDPAPLRSVVRADTRLTHSRLDTGPASIESHLDEALAVPDTVTKLVEAERAGADAAVIDCMGDPGLQPARETCRSMLVMGPAQTSMHVAAMLGQRFSVIAVLDSTVPMLEDLAAVYGLSTKLASVRSIGIPVLELEQDVDRMVDALAKQSVAAVRDDGAHVIVLGCTGMAGVAAEVGARLEGAGHPGIPVIDPVVTAVKVAEALVDLGLKPSARTYGA